MVNSINPFYFSPGKERLPAMLYGKVKRPCLIKHYKRVQQHTFDTNNVNKIIEYKLPRNFV